MPMLGGECSECCGGCGRCVVNGQVNPDYRTQAECERCRQCVEMLQTECNGDCPDGSLPSESLVTLEFSSEECGSGGGGSVVIGCGTILSATITNGGSGYATVELSEPTLTLTAQGGTGGAVAITSYSKYTDSFYSGYWGIAGLSVASGGSGYTDNAAVTISLGTDDKQKPGTPAPTIRIRTVADPPADDWTLTSYSQNGSGLVVSLTLARLPYLEGYGPLFEATAATVVDGGADYEVGDELDAIGSTTDPGNPAVLSVTSVDGNGAVTGLSVLFGGYHEGTDTGVIESAEFTSTAVGLPSSQGAYRKETVEVCEVAVSIVQESPSAGTGATITATVDSTPASPSFGKVTGLTVTNGGSGYVALCEKKTTVASCDECPPRESPESATCNETGGCPCGTWVVDNNQEPCECCQWTLIPSPYAVGFTPSESNSQEQNDCVCNAYNQSLQDMADALEAAGWTVTLGPPPEGFECGGSLTAVCEECERAIPDRFYVPFLSVSQSPCDPEQWAEMSTLDYGSACVPGAIDPIGVPGFACLKSGQTGASESFSLYEYSSNGQYYIPKCGQRITECSCCQRLAALPVTGSLVLDPNTVLEEFDAACCGDCPQGMFWVCRSGRCNPLP